MREELHLMQSAFAWLQSVAIANRRGLLALWAVSCMGRLGWVGAER